MIAKRVERKKATSNMARLARYIMDLDGGVFPRNWKLTSDYILDSNIQNSKKVASVRVTNCHTDDPVMATEFILKTQDQNKKSKSDKTYHLVLSFPAGETLEREILYEIEDKFCNALGYKDHQRISAIHKDTANLHVHIAINKINPENFRNYEPFFDKRTLMKTCQKIEQEYNLIKTPHGFEYKENQYSKYEIDDIENARQPKIKNFEYKTGIQSLSTYVRKITKEFDYTNWPELHKNLSDHGLIIKKQGNGLVIGIPDLDLWVKASSCDRGLSLSALEKKIGPYKSVKPIIHKQYVPIPHGKDSQTKTLLYSRYEEQKKASNIERQKRYQILRMQKIAFYNQLFVWYKQQCSLVKMAPKNSRAALRNTLKLQKKLRQQELKENQAVVKRKLAENKFPTWRDWLHQQANIGDKDAVNILHSMNERRAILSDNLLTTKTAKKTGVFLRKSLKPSFLKNGNILYKSMDGGTIIDAGEKIHAQKFTTGSAYIALSLAVEKFKDQPLVLNGTDEFKKEVARLAGIHGMSVVFSDPILNTFKNEVEQQDKNNTNDSIQEWIAERNRYTENLPHVMWSDEEAVFNYVGRRKIREKNVLLFELNQKIFVKETSSRGFVQAGYWGKSAKVKITKNSVKKLSDKEIEA
ncbi:TraI/MobA(P) family conjugative relaxase [Bartonella harrusi]|uniref:Relaxase/mobilization nuclease domain-containing protein n=1 Tax=Bartonella harrusi TaxID=2961895 RepID=A0ABY5EQK1_9HYPH|nr:TraI/MobA(P) family conjugative relaxase [Bartonella harrusi]UTO27674.1 relaxase/mobilization nuclease domain-containing protein [Bartonella harrusi]